MHHSEGVESNLQLCLLCATENNVTNSVSPGGSDTCKDHLQVGNRRDVGYSGWRKFHGGNGNHSTTVALEEFPWTGVGRLQVRVSRFEPQPTTNTKPLPLSVWVFVKNPHQCGSGCGAPGLIDL